MIKVKNHVAAMAFLEALQTKKGQASTRDVVRALNFHPNEELFSRVDNLHDLPTFANVLETQKLIVVLSGGDYQITSEGERYLRTEAMTKMDRPAIDLAILETLDEQKHSGQSLVPSHQLLQAVQITFPDVDKSYLVARVESLEDDEELAVKWLRGGDEVIEFHARITGKGERHLSGQEKSSGGSTFVFNNSPVGAVIHQSQQVAMQNISVNLQELGKQDTGFAETFENLTESINSSSMTESDKKDALEAVADLSEEAAKPPDQRKQSRVKGAMSFLKESLLTTGVAVELVHKIGQYFGGG